MSKINSLDIFKKPKILLLMFLKNEVGCKNRIIYVRLSLIYSIADQVAGFYISGSLALN